jgi:L-glutamine-phosphate cytidylyltransferase
MLAVILAAGKGSRLGEHTTDLPKSLLPLNDEGKTLLDYNMQLLQKLGVGKILIVTGFNSGKIEEHVKNYTGTRIVYNPFWNHCNVLGSLYMALGHIDEEFLFLHADTLAVEEIWTGMLAGKGDMVLPFQRKKCGEEEMKVVLNGETIVEISKEIDPPRADGEYLGIAKFSSSTISYFKSKAESLFKTGNLNYYMEEVISQAIKEDRFDIRAMDILHHNFVEVDFEEDYLRAKAQFGAL